MRNRNKYEYNKLTIYCSRTTATAAATTMPSDWATLSSTPCHNRFALLPREDDDAGDTDADDRPFTTVERRGSKRTRRGTTPQQQSQRQQHQQQQQQQRPQQPVNSARISTAVIGKAVNTNVIAIKAARKIRRRAVFCVDNVDVSCSVDDLCSFARKLSVNVISCFEVKPRQRKNGMNDVIPCDCKAFRLCIFDEERDRLLNAAAWPDSVKISPWYFKNDNGIVNRRAAPGAVSGADDNVVTNLDLVDAPSRASVTANAAAAAAVLAPVESAPSADAANMCDENSDGSNTVCMSDETILSALQTQ